MNDDSGLRSSVMWQKAQELALALTQIVQRLPRDRSAEIIGAQLLRAAGSISANVAEGYGRFADGAFRNHLSIARGSLFEAESWLDLLCRSGILDSSAAVDLKPRFEEVGRLLTSRMRTLDAAKGRNIREEEVRYDA